MIHTLRIAGLVLVILSFKGCTGKLDSDPFSNIEDSKVREVVSRAIDRAGGWEKWTRLLIQNFVMSGITFSQRF